ncbi:beta-phosphoglucomutase [Anaerocolumna sedimenticola]|uniref:Beta-phosphoglucomutase n=1 Tax=Anaerocolumna sedimenticola TaxID=2696063 RepID=A0A6P1TLU5_9FIRM|nr:beta-phosphoglucomutase [Anaerocolumna sedimenticola]QHQ60268.1 beta-phosphoglucomutase [Anaerocolumna sedimenticola]
MDEIKGLLFDLDGVIVDTAKYHYLAWKELAEKLKIPFTEKDNERLKGVSRMRSFEIILEIGGLELSKEEKEKYCTIKNNIYLEYIYKLKQEEVLPGVNEFLNDARKKGYKIALGSASKNAGVILSRLMLTDTFDAIIDGTKVNTAKPDPEVFLLGAKELGLKKEACIVFEDAKAGVDAAHNGGMKAIGIGRKENLPNADICIPGLFHITIDDLMNQL